MQLKFCPGVHCVHELALEFRRATAFSVVVDCTFSLASFKTVVYRAFHECNAVVKVEVVDELARRETVYRY